MKVNKIYNRDCLEGMEEMDNRSVDLIVTDPPYGMEFMGKQWDKAVPKIKIWRECLRVLKHGAFAFVMCIPRQDCLSRMIVNLEDAGFNMGFTSIYWAFGSGFPKAGNISKMVDKKFGAEREVIGKDKHWGEAGNSIGIGGQEWDITEPATPQAKALNGSYSGFQPKPAVEIIIVAMRPLSEKTYVDQALKNGKGITFLDDCRIPFQSEQERQETKPWGKIHPKRGNHPNWELDNEMTEPPGANSKGRFPANLLVSDDVLNDGKVGKSGIRKPSENDFKKDKLGLFDGGWKEQCNLRGVEDSGSFSRYFDLDAWWSERIRKLPKEVQKTFPFLIVPKPSKAEKDKGLDNINVEKKDVEHRYGRYRCKKCGKLKLDHNPCKCGIEAKFEKIDVNKNIHPTTKPVQLMSYLITLGSRENDITLDPFIGSGTTAIAARILNRKFIGFEIESEYYKIANARLNATLIRPSIRGKL